MVDPDCDECEGEGFIETMKICNRPPSDCCGGCTESHPCPKCGEPDEPSGDEDYFDWERN